MELVSPEYRVVQCASQRLQATCCAQFALSPVLSGGARGRIEYLYRSLNVAAVVAQWNGLQSTGMEWPYLPFRDACMARPRPSLSVVNNGAAFPARALFSPSFAA
jgi:hypothetical protein